MTQQTKQSRQIIKWLLPLVLIAGLVVPTFSAQPGGARQDPTATPSVTPIGQNESNVIRDGSVLPRYAWLNLRPAPTGNPDEVIGVHVVTRLYRGDVVEVLDDPAQCIDGHTWFKVRLIKRVVGDDAVGAEGWVAAQIQQTVGDTVNVRPDPCCSVAITVDAGTYLRAGPGPDFQKLGPPVAAYGVLDYQLFTGLAQSPNWVYVASLFLGREGWVRKDYVGLRGTACAGLEMREEPLQPTIPPTSSSPTVTPTLAPVTTTCRITVTAPGGVLLRESANESSPVVSWNIVQGTEVIPVRGPIAIDTFFNWWLVRWENVQGWMRINSQFTQFSGNCSAFQ